MNKILEIWKHPEVFKDYNFTCLDAKIAFIQKHRKQYEICNRVIKELNNRIDIDFIQDSELLEYNTVKGLPEITFDEDFEELFETNIFDKTVKTPEIDDFFFGKYRTVLKDGRLTIYRRDPETHEIRKFTCGMPKHLAAVKETLQKARDDKSLKDLGLPAPIEVSFIEDTHRALFADHIFLNRRLGRNGEVLEPLGYGKFRETVVLQNGTISKQNIVVEGLDWYPSDSDDVRSDMEHLVDYYNNSTLHPIIKACLFKTCLVNMQPFRDGNKRVSRILLNYLLVRNGIPTVTINATEREKYFNSLNKAITTSDYSDFIKMVTDEIDYRCNQYINVIDKLNLEEKNIPTSKKVKADEDDEPKC